MLDFEHLKTRKGAVIIAHFEDEAVGKVEISRLFPSQEIAERKLCDFIERNNADNGEGTTVHWLVNRTGLGKILTDSMYQEWQQTGGRWFIRSDNDFWFRETFGASAQEILDL